MVTKRGGFTLIELLIVVAIIAVLAAIAVPNFLEAQVRSKVSRVKAEFRAVATAVEAYALDGGAYPVGTLGDTLWNLGRLTSPVAYMSSVGFQDPFVPRDAAIANPNSSYLYYSYRSPGMYSPGAAAQGLGSFIPEVVGAWLTAQRGPKMWLVTSLGPDRSYDAMVLAPVAAWRGNVGEGLNRNYDATNGTVSDGDLGRLGGDVRGTGGVVSN